ncbi:LD-carboxypeptidase [Bacillus sp. FJAT-49732]|uniref:LD-carboxypeptidase n=1 Tax=Lederbergia citrisecunda TaxID=2833583 RepID=A0A942TT28_9BACI|nr:S66 peptidase family protein [Lederbergia citrisecunda]MBS4201667.1 LD-carboxypeptidase [Lederbergia citrisecunda]
MIRYPKPLKAGGTIGITAPSSGVPEALHPILAGGIEQFKKRGFKVEVGKTPWTNEKTASAEASIRAAELNYMLQDSNIETIIPPWGGEILMEILPLIQWDQIQPKWILGYSDTSTLLFAITVITGIATAHGTNLVDLRSNEWDETTKKFMDVLTGTEGDTIIQSSSEKYQSEWNHDKQPNPYVYELDTPTSWKTLNGKPLNVDGRLLGGCIDTLQNLVGTPYANIKSFREKYVKNEKILWYLENCEMSATDFYRSLLQLHYAGWFEQSSGIIFGRTSAGEEVNGFSTFDAMERLSQMTGLPIIYDADIGHVPPQITLVNGAKAEVKVENGLASVKMELK